MAHKTQLRLTQMSGSAFDDSQAAAALGTLNLPHLSASLDHMASAIKRIARYSPLRPYSPRRYSKHCSSLCAIGRQSCTRLLHGEENY